MFLHEMMGLENAHSTIRAKRTEACVYLAGVDKLRESKRQTSIPAVPDIFFLCFQSGLSKNLKIISHGRQDNAVVLEEQSAHGAGTTALLKGKL